MNDFRTVHFLRCDGLTPNLPMLAARLYVPFVRALQGLYGCHSLFWSLPLSHSAKFGPSKPLFCSSRVTPECRPIPPQMLHLRLFVWMHPTEQQGTTLDISLQKQYGSVDDFNAAYCNRLNHSEHPRKRMAELMSAEATSCWAWSNARKSTKVNLSHNLWNNVVQRRNELEVSFLDMLLPTYHSANH